MPSPLGHALGAVAAGWVVGGRVWPGWHATLFSPWRGRERAEPRAIDVHSTHVTTAFYLAAGVAPDLDLLAGSHSTYTHSVGAVGLVFVATFGLCRWLLHDHRATAPARTPRFAAGVAAAWASHILLDWLGSDSRAPIGVMALWPFTSAHYQSGLYLFDAISRRYWLPEQFVWGNLRAALKECLLLGPVAAAAYWVTIAKGRKSRGSPGSN